MKQVVKLRTLPTDGQATALDGTLRKSNAAASWLSQQMHAARVFRKVDAQHRFYTELREQFGLAAQPAIRVIGKVADAYAALRANIAAGTYGPPGRTSVARNEDSPIVFRPLGAQPFDARCLSWQFPDDIGGRAATVSIWTVAGRLKNLQIGGDPTQMMLLRSRAIGETDLIYRDGKWFLHATIDAPEAPLADPANGFLGVDLGIVNIATTSSGEQASGTRLNRYRKRQARLRKRLQAKKTSSARRLLKKRRRKESRFAADVNHQISKRILAEAERTECGIAVEKLTGIRDRVRLRKPQRATLHSWAFAQLGSFLAYKAKQAGLALVEVDPPPTPRRHALLAAGSTNTTAAPKRYSNVAGVASLGTPTTTQRSTSPPAVSNAGAKSCAHTQRLPSQPARAVAASLSAARTEETSHKLVPQTRVHDNGQDSQHARD